MKSPTILSVGQYTTLTVLFPTWMFTMQNVMFKALDLFLALLCIFNSSMIALWLS